MHVAGVCWTVSIVPDSSCCKGMSIVLSSSVYCCIDSPPQARMPRSQMVSCLILAIADADTPSTSDALPTKLCSKCGKLWPYSSDPRYKKPPLSIEVGYSIVNRNGVFVPDNQCKECIKAGDQASKTAREGRQVHHTLHHIQCNQYLAT